MSGLGLLPGGNAMAEALAAPKDFFDMEILIHAGDADVQSRTTYWVQPAVLIQCLGIGRPASHSSAQIPGFCGNHVPDYKSFGRTNSTSLPPP
jgi:hypothetical protein